MNLRSFTAEQGRLIRWARMEADKTQKQTALAIGKSTSTIGRWERGSGSPTMKDLYYMSRLFKKPLRQIAFVGDGGEYLDISELPPELRAILRAQVAGLISFVLGRISS